MHKLRHRRNTRYGWWVKPYPTGTYTLQDASSFLDALTLLLWGGYRSEERAKINRPSTAGANTNFLLCILA
ncbi:MAG: hypothetical protein ACI9OH_001069 [Oleispira sp.]